MIFNFRKKLDPEELKKKAELDFIAAVESSKEKSRSAKQQCLRIALQCRSNIDKLFVDSARLTEEYDELAVAAIAAGMPLPKPPEPTNFQLIKIGDNYIYSYIPDRYSKKIFALAAAYQTTKLNRNDTINQTQMVANDLFDELGISQTFNVLQFLRDEEESVENPDNNEP